MAANTHSLTRVLTTFYSLVSGAKAAAPSPWASNTTTPLRFPSTQPIEPGSFDQFIQVSVTPVSSRRQLINGAAQGAGRRHRFIGTIALFVRRQTGQQSLMSGSDYFYNIASERNLPVADATAAPHKLVTLVPEVTGPVDTSPDSAAWHMCSVQVEMYLDDL